MKSHSELYMTASSHFQPIKATNLVFFLLLQLFKLLLAQENGECPREQELVIVKKN